MALGKGIPLINGFDLNSKLPLDSRTVADTKENMNALVTNGSVGDGQLCYCKADKKLYVLKEGTWSEVGGSGGGGQIIDINNQMGPDGNTITQEGYNLIQQAYENNTLLGVSFVMFDTIEAVCMFDYVSLDIETMTNTYCFKFEAGETIIFKIKSDLTIVQSAQSSIAVYSQFTDLWYEGDYVSAIMSNETIYKIPYTLIYTSKDAYQNERLQFKNDTYDKTIYNIPLLPTDASNKNYALNSVNGTLTWNTIGDGLEITNGALQTTLDIDTTLTIPTSYFQLGVANDNKAILMTNENATTLVNEINSLPISELLKYDKFSVKLSLNSNIMKATFRKKYNVIGSDGNINTTNYNVELYFLLSEQLYNVEMELQFWNTKYTFNANYSWCKVHVVDKM